MSKYKERRPMMLGLVEDWQQRGQTQMMPLGEGLQTNG